jgi:hypothetical protein
MLKLKLKLKSKLKPQEAALLATLVGALAFALFGPAITQPAHQHAFADQRVLAGIPFAMDVLSNVSFLAWGIAGLTCLFSLLKRVKMNTEHTLAGLFCLGLVATSAASSWYHLQPDDAGLGMDRLGMVVAFAGLLGLAVAGRIGHRAGVCAASTVVLLGPLGIWFWLASGNVLPWLVIQFGGMALILWMATLRPLQGALVVRWSVVLLVYAAAKLLELKDHEIYEMTSHVISGHTLKHLLASFAAWPVVSALSLALASASKQSKNQGRIHLENSDRSPAH